jgi:phosphoglucosamine mutase
MQQTERRLFGTDGVRGEANAGLMTVETAVRIGRAVGATFRSSHERVRVLIGKDTRRSCYLFETALVAGICSVGADPYLVGPLPTPGIAYMTTGMRCDVGVVISASHNPFQDNGIKLFGKDGFKLPDLAEARLEAWMSDDSKIDAALRRGADIGRAYRIEDARGRYVVFLKERFNRNLTLDGVKIAVDCANGAGYRVAPAVFEELGADVVTLGVAPNGLNINDGCGALHPERLAKVVVEQGCDIGIALDGDADRLIVVDEKGRVVDGDQILALCALWMKQERLLKHDTLVVTQMSNFGLETAMRAHGIELVRTDVGDRYVVDAMRSGDFNLGGEQSGHLLFLDHSTTGDGILAALRVLEIMLSEQQPLSDLATVMSRAPQVLLNVRVREKPPLRSIDGLSDVIAEVERELEGRGRLLLRYSGTEPKCRVMVEANDAEIVERLAERVADAVSAKIGA